MFMALGRQNLKNLAGQFYRLLLTVPNNFIVFFVIFIAIILYLYRKEFYIKINESYNKVTACLLVENKKIVEENFERKNISFYLVIFK